MDWSKISVCFCLPGETFSHRFMTSWTATVKTFEELGIPWIMSVGQGSNIVHLRNKVAGGNPQAGEFQTPHKNAEYTHQVWIDSDQVWKPDQIFELLKHDVDVVSGCIRTEDGDYALHRDHKRLTELPKGLEEVDSCGFGFVVIRRKVFEQIPFPWFRMMPHYTGLGDDSEDVSFCRRVREAGMKVMADGNVRIGHEKTAVI